MPTPQSTVVLERGVEFHTYHPPQQVAEQCLLTNPETMLNLDVVGKKGPTQVWFRAISVLAVKPYKT